MPESLLNDRFRGTTMSHSEIIIALENTIVDKVSTVPSSRNRRNDTNAPMEIGMAAKRRRRKCEPRRRSENCGSRVAGCLQRNRQRNMGDSAKVKIGMRKGGKGEKDGGKNSWQKGSGKKVGKGQEKGGKGDSRTCWTCGETGHIAARCRKGGKHKFLKTTVRTLKSRPKTKRICKHGACWRKARTNSDKR